MASMPTLPSAGMTGASPAVKGKSGGLPVPAMKQARFGYLGHLGGLTLGRGVKPTGAAKNLAAIDGTDFQPAVCALQRCSTPWQYNTPQRMQEAPLALGQEDAASTTELTKLSSSAPLPQNYIRRVRKRAQRDLYQHEGSWKKQVADLKILADSASRAGQMHQAAQAYHKMGVILDNASQFKEAVHMYKQFLALCISSKNQQGETLAYNCLGIDFFKLKNYDESIQYHNKHLELADHTGRLVAHTNLGIVFQAMGLNEHAAIHHQHAIEYANRLGSKDAQCFAVGNLGVAAFQQGDLQTSRICMQYHLNMARRQKGKDKSNFTTLANNSVDNDAHHQLGQVSAADGRLEEASSHFARSVEISRQMKDQASEERSCVMLGVAQGMLNFDQHREALLQPQVQSLTDFVPELGQDPGKAGSELAALSDAGFLRGDAGSAESDLGLEDFSFG